MHTIFFESITDIASRSREQIDARPISAGRLFYNSPATLQYNSPGAFGFGVKRAGLLLPESVMILVSPSCCGRTDYPRSLEDGYADRMYYLTIDETDLVTGRHLKKIADACADIMRMRREDIMNSEARQAGSLSQDFSSSAASGTGPSADPGTGQAGSLSGSFVPRAILICITCVDALLGTDMDRICRKAQEAAGVPVLPAYMYAITREGRRPPMVLIRQTLYSLLSPSRQKDPHAVNLLGNFAPLEDDCELKELLRQAGFTTIREISACRTFDEYLRMSEASLNIVLNPESRTAAEDMRTRLGIGYIELTRLYRLPAIRKQYAALASALEGPGERFDDELFISEARSAVRKMKRACGVFVPGSESADSACVGDSADSTHGCTPVQLADSSACSVPDSARSPLADSSACSIPDSARSQLADSSACSVPDSARSPLADSSACSVPDSARSQLAGASFAIGQMVNANPFELACALVHYGMRVACIFAGYTSYDLPFIRLLARISPRTRVYSSLDPSMMNFRDCVPGNPPDTDTGGFLPGLQSAGKHPCGQAEAPAEAESADHRTAEGHVGGQAAVLPPVDFAVGEDAAWYFPAAQPVIFNDQRQPFGYRGLIHFCEAVLTAASLKSSGAQAGTSLRDSDAPGCPMPGTASCNPTPVPATRHLFHSAPPASDSAGACSALYELGGMTVILDAGGCSGNICGIDEPRWHRKKSAVYSAGIRDMDAILGRDDRLTEKIGNALENSKASFIALIGTPVPAVIGTDLTGLSHVLEQKFHLPVLPIETTGMEHYDIGIRMALEQIVKRFVEPSGNKAAASASAVSADAGTVFKAAAPEYAGAGFKTAAPADADTVFRAAAPEYAGADSVPGKISPASSSSRSRTIGVWGLTPLDFPDQDPKDLLRYLCPEIRDNDRLILYGISTEVRFGDDTGVITGGAMAGGRLVSTATGSGDDTGDRIGTSFHNCLADTADDLPAKADSGIDILRHAGEADLNLAVSPAAVKTVKKLERMFGTSYAVLGTDGGCDPCSPQGSQADCSQTDCARKTSEAAQGQTVPTQKASETAQGQTVPTQEASEATQGPAVPTQKTSGAVQGPTVPVPGDRILIIHQQFIANALRLRLRSAIQDIPAPMTEDTSRTIGKAPANGDARTMMQSRTDGLQPDDSQTGGLLAGVFRKDSLQASRLQPAASQAGGYSRTGGYSQAGGYSQEGGYSRTGGPVIDCATWFLLDPDYAEEGDVHLNSEMQLRQLISERGYTAIYGDPAYRFLFEGTDVRYIDCPHAAVSGRACPTFIRL